MSHLFSPDGPAVTWEGTEPRACDVDTAWVPRGIVDASVTAIRGTLRDLDQGLYAPDRAADYIRASLRLLDEALDEHAEDAPCGYDGPVHVTVVGHRHPTAEWACPRCGADHADDTWRDDR